MKKKLYTNKGFTLIELLIVIVIIGILTSLILANFIGVRQRARDGERKADLRQMQGALELYRSDEGGYPQTGAFSCSTSSNAIKTDTVVYLQPVPCDPLSGNDYTYTSDGTTYSIVACLENANDSSKDAAVDASCTDASFTVHNP